jgi:hypothetical protein
MSQSLMERYDDQIAGVLSCYDRLVITGPLMRCVVRDNVRPLRARKVATIAVSIATSSSLSPTPVHPLQMITGAAGFYALCIASSRMYGFEHSSVRFHTLWAFCGCA